MDPNREALAPSEATPPLNVPMKAVLWNARRGQLPGTKRGIVWRSRRSEMLALLTAPEAP